MTILKKLHISACLLAILGIMATSCSAVYDDLPECASGAELRFIYDYHMERGNSFMYAVDCLTVYIYDEQGRYVGTRTETSSVLADENWRMRVDLPAGRYHIVAYGGMECGEASFMHPAGTAPAPGSHYSSLRTVLKPEGTDPSRTAPLHDHFWGEADITVSGQALVYDEATVEMRKNTNNIRVVLQHLNGEPVDPGKFRFEIVDDNTLMGHDNALIPAGKVSYPAWMTGSTDMGMFPDGEPLINGYAQFSVGRLVQSDDQPRIRITRASTGDPVMDLDLIWLIRQARLQNVGRAGSTDMPLQEYLDRESRWTFYFLLNENDIFNNLTIRVNDWIVRFNDTEM